MYVSIYPSTYFFPITIWGIYYYNASFTDKDTKAQNSIDSVAGGGRADNYMKAAWPLSLYSLLCCTDSVFLDYKLCDLEKITDPLSNYSWKDEIKNNSTSKLALREKKGTNVNHPTHCLAQSTISQSCCVPVEISNQVPKQIFCFRF